METNQEQKISAALTALRETIDELEAVREREVELNKKRYAIERELLSIHESTGLVAMANDYISVSVEDKDRATYAPDCWDDVLKWAVETGNMNIIQRRLSDAKVVALIGEGIPLPAGLGIEPYKKISHRRK